MRVSKQDLVLMSCCLVACSGEIAEDVDESSLRLEALVIDATMEGSGTGSGSVQTHEATTPDAESVSAPEPDAVLDFGEGQQFEVYDFGEVVLLSETGSAAPAARVSGVRPLDAVVGGSRLVDVWALHQGDLTDNVVELGSKIAEIQAESAGFTETEVSSSSDASGFEQGASSAVDPMGGFHQRKTLWCGNGCCDPDWLRRDFGECYCQGVKGDWEYFAHPSFTWSWANYSGLGGAAGLVCAAEGQSTWHWSYGGNSYVWSVPHATFRRAHSVSPTKVGGGFRERTLSSSVNTVAHGYPHSYCGWAHGTGKWDQYFCTAP